MSKTTTIGSLSKSWYVCRSHCTLMLSNGPNIWKNRNATSQNIKFGFPFSIFVDCWVCCVHTLRAGMRMRPRPHSFCTSCWQCWNYHILKGFCSSPYGPPPPPPPTPPPHGPWAHVWAYGTPREPHRPGSFQNKCMVPLSCTWCKTWALLLGNRSGIDM